MIGPFRTFRTIGTCAAVLLLCGCSCFGGKKLSYLERMNADMSEAAHGFTTGTLTGRQYLDLSTDRAGKARRFHDDAGWRDQAEKGDKDRDGVPDAYDACDTPRLQPTDEKGCPRQQRPQCDAQDPRCGPSPEDDRRTQDLLDEVTLMFNPRCDGSPVPQVPEPLEWGRSPGPHVGFNLAVTEVDNQSPGCELFYELELRAEWQEGGGIQVRHLTVLFKASEDFKPADSRRAVFGVPMPENVPTSPARDDLRKALGHAPTVRWRARAVNGAEVMSPWSSVREQGPASAGVPG